LMAGQEQQTIARVYISAFLDATLKGNTNYQPLFMDHRVGRHWLPETVYISQYEQAGTRYIGTFQEDLDLSTATLPQSHIESWDLSIWREQALSLQWGDYNTRGVILGWNTIDNDTIEPCYKISWPENAIDIHQNSILVFSMTETGEKADPPGKKDTNNNTNDKNSNGNIAEDKTATDDDQTEEDKDAPVFIDFTIRLTDANGQILEFPLSSCSLLQPRLKRQLTKFAFMQTADRSEGILQHFYFPLHDLQTVNVDFDIEQITAISFIFNKTATGVVAINNIGVI